LELGIWKRRDKKLLKRIRIVVMIDLYMIEECYDHNVVLGFLTIWRSTDQVGYLKLEVVVKRKIASGTRTNPSKNKRYLLSVCQAVGSRQPPIKLYR
jgi:hypothetical protein